MRRIDFRKGKNWAEPGESALKRKCPAYCGARESIGGDGGGSLSLPEYILEFV